MRPQVWGGTQVSPPTPLPIFQCVRGERERESPAKKGCLGKVLEVHFKEHPTCGYTPPSPIDSKIAEKLYFCVIFEFFLSHFESSGGRVCSKKAPS